MKRVTIKEVKELARKHRIKCKYDSEYQEWNIDGYMTNDNEDALSQVKFFAATQDWAK